jgi:hypothetical protein
LHILHIERAALTALGAPACVRFDTQRALRTACRGLASVRLGDADGTRAITEACLRSERRHFSARLRRS